MLTAYDFPTGRLCETTDVDITLVGDSLAQVCLGYDSTVKLTLDEMIHHCRAVGRGSKTPLLIADMPFGTYFNPEDAIRNAARLMREGGVEGVKMEGGLELVDTVRKLTAYGIPVIGHVGLMPQRHTSLGGYRARGGSAKDAERILTQALRLQEAGAFALVVEAVPGVVGTVIAERVNRIPVIGIGAGPHVNGQVLVVSDAIGVTPESPRFARRFAQVKDVAQLAIHRYVEAVKTRNFPNKDQNEIYGMRHQQRDIFWAATGFRGPKSSREPLDDKALPTSGTGVSPEPLGVSPEPFEEPVEDVQPGQTRFDADAMNHLKSLLHKHASS